MFVLSSSTPVRFRNTTYMHISIMFAGQAPVSGHLSPAPLLAAYENFSRKRPAPVADTFASRECPLTRASTVLKIQPITNILQTYVSRPLPLHFLGPPLFFIICYWKSLNEQKPTDVTFALYLLLSLTENSVRHDFYLYFNTNSGQNFKVLVRKVRTG